MEDEITSAASMTTSPHSTFPKWAAALTRYSVLVPEDLSDAFVRALAARTLGSLRFSDHKTIRHVVAWFSDEDLRSSASPIDMLEFICEYSSGIDSEMSHLIDYTTFARKLERLPVVEAHGLLSHLNEVVIQRAFIDLIALLTVATMQENPKIVYELSILQVKDIIATGKPLITCSDMRHAATQKTFLDIIKCDGNPNALREFLEAFIRSSSDENLYRLASRFSLPLRLEIFKLIKTHMNVTQLIVEYI